MRIKHTVPKTQQGLNKYYLSLLLRIFKPTLRTQNPTEVTKGDMTKQQHLSETLFHLATSSV